MISQAITNNGVHQGFRWIEGEWPDDIRCEHIRTARQKRAGERCHKPRMSGRSGNQPSRYCYYHAKWHDNLNPGKRSQPVNRLRNVPKFYQNHLSKTLDEVLNESLEQDPTKQTSVLEELALFRAAAGPTVALYSGMLDLYNSSEPADKDKRLQQLIACGAVMREALAEVCRIAESANRITSTSAGRISVAQLHFFVDQVTRCAFEAFGDDPRAVVFQQMLKSQVKLPVDGGSAGTVTTPDMDMAAMNATVPMYVDIDAVSTQLPFQPANTNGAH